MSDTHTCTALGKIYESMNKVNGEKIPGSTTS